jgi:hypothetical protein
MQADTEQRSVAGDLDAVFLPVKVFFVLIVVAIGALLAVWRNRLHQHYARLIPAIERGIIIGGIAMLFWPVMDYGYQQTTNVLFGRWSTGPQLRLSLVIAPWVLLLLFYFLTRLGKQGELIGQISGVIVAAIAILRYEDLNDWAVRLLGIGAGTWVAVVLGALMLSGFVALLRRWPDRELQDEAPTS